MTGADRSQTSRLRRNARACAPIAAMLVGASLALVLTRRSEPDPREQRRIEALEQALRRMAAKAEAAQIAREAAQAPRTAVTASRAYAIHCAPSWRELGPIGQGLWGCRTPEPVQRGFYPNCNLTASRIASGLSARQYFEHAVAHSAQLAAAKQLGARELVVHGHAAYEASFEHDATGTPLRVLASIFVAGDRAYAVTCSAPPADFESVAPRFREIAASFEDES